MSDFNEKIRELAKIFGQFSRNFNQNLISKSDEVNYFLLKNKEYIKKKYNINNSNELDDTFNEIFTQIFVYISILIFSEKNFLFNSSSEHQEYILLRNDKNEYILENQYNKIIDLNLKLPESFINSVLKPLENLLIFNQEKIYDVRDIFIKSEFYSEYLKSFDPITSKNKGVNYTPNEIIVFMCKGIVNILKTHFNISFKELYSLKSNESKEKNNNHNISVLEPAAGTMLFIIELLSIIFSKNDLPKLLNLSINRFLEKLKAVELLVAPYLIGVINIEYYTHKLMEISNILKEDEIKITNSIFLMNTLSKRNKNYWEEHSNFLNKSDSIEIIVGNPPYNLDSQNNSIWIQNLVDDYKKNLNEKNLKILSDDYVKFIRFSQWKIQNSGRGMLVFITNNNFLDGSVFKIMRRNLLSTFNEIYIINLHGNMRKGEKANPFNIQVGICIFFMIRSDKNYTISEKQLDDLDYLNEVVKISYYDVPQSNINEKFLELMKISDFHTFENIQVIDNYFFIPKDYKKELKYKNFIPITDLFIKSPKSGIMTGRDSLVSGLEKDLLKENMNLFFSENFEELKKLNVIIKKTKSWDPQKALSNSSQDQAIRNIIKYNYRGFDERYLVYDNALVEGCRLGYLDLITEQNLAISITRSIRADHFSHVLVTNKPPEKCFLAVKDSSYVFTLKSGSNNENNIKIPNLGFNMEPDEIFYYIYGILFSSIYRNRYIEQLKSNFPSIPFPNSKINHLNREIFEEMSKMGKILVKLHIKESEMIDPQEFPKYFDLDKRIIEPFYDRETKKIFFNKPKKGTENNIPWIGNISKDMWDFEIGSIKQLMQWLIGRKYVDPNESIKSKRHHGLRRELNNEEINEFLILCSVIKNTLEIIPEIDKIYEKIDPL